MSGSPIISSTFRKRLKLVTMVPDTPGRIRGTQARLDYIAVSANIEPSLVETWVSPDIDLTLHRCDHDCVCAQTFNLSLFKLIADLAINA